MADVCWGHDTGVTEPNVRDFSGNWTGTGTILDAGVADDERVALNEGEYEDSETWNLGIGTATVTLDKYGSGSGPTPDIYYKNGVSQAACDADTWHLYDTNFYCNGWAKVRVHYPGDFLFADTVDFLWQDDGDFKWQDS